MVQVKKKSTRKYAAATFPMMLVALYAASAMIGDKAILQGLAPAPETNPTKHKAPRVFNEEYEKRIKRWYKHTKSMPICNMFKAVCNEDGLLPRLKASVAAGAKMRSSVMGIGGGPVGYLCLLCAAIGIYFSHKWGKLMGNRRSDKLVGDGTTSSNTTVVQYQAIKNKASDIEDQASPHKVYEDDKAKGSSLYHPEPELAGADCLESSPAVPSFLKNMSNNTMTYLSGTSFTWRDPVTTYKIFIALLLVIELNDLMAPEISVMFTPEIIALERAKPDPREWVPYTADILTPSLNPATADLWYQRLKAVRTVLVLSWMAYLVLPPKKIGGACYIVGALLYIYLATIGLMYNLGHSMQGGILFILLSIFAVPFFGCPKYGDRSARWLRRMLYIVVFVPIYLFSGVCKFRYKGFWPQWTGSWMTSAFTKKGMRRSISPTLYMFIRERTWAMALFSWGNVVIEYILPLAMLLWIENPIVQALFHLSSILFHASVFVLMGPNFIRYCLMHILAWNPFGGFGWRPRPTTETTVPQMPVTWLDKLQAGITFYCLIAWFYVQFISDFDHLTGKVDRMERRNPYFPFPELSMFAKPKDPNFTCALILLIISVICYVLVLFTRWSLVRDSTETDFFYWLPFYNKNKNKIQHGTMVIPLGEEEIALAAKNGQRFVVYNGSTASSLPKRRGDSPVLYMVTKEDE